MATVAVMLVLNKLPLLSRPNTTQMTECPATTVVENSTMWLLKGIFHIVRRRPWIKGSDQDLRKEKDGSEIIEKLICKFEFILNKKALKINQFH